MAEQYFESNPNSEHNLKTWSFDLLDNKLKFTTDNGVFSKNTVDFGSRTLIDAFNNEVSKKDFSLLDLGCGYGPIGLSIAKSFPEASITMTDVNNRALELAKQNSDLNDIKNVKIFESSVYENITEKFDFILTNPPIRAGKDIVSGMLKGAVEHLNDNGALFAVLQKKQGAPSAKKLMEETFGNAEIITKNKGYYILKSVYGN